jgi:hypothetical protein
MELAEITEKITKREKWPDFVNGPRLDKLEALARAAYRRRSIDGYLSYVLITHQICDELTRLLISHCRFTLQLFLVPVSFDYKFSSKPNNTDLEKLTSGQLLNVLDYSLEFEGKNEFLAAARELTETRNVFAHQLARHSRLSDIAKMARTYRYKFMSVEKGFWEANDLFLLFYKDQRKDDHWDWLLQDALENTEDAAETAILKRLTRMRRSHGFGL